MSVFLAGVYYQEAFNILYTFSVTFLSPSLFITCNKKV